MTSGASQTISRKKLQQLHASSEKSAKAVNLMYVNDRQPGIRRVKRGKNFTYILDKKSVSDKEMLKRIRGLVIPPAWQDVWICAEENGHLQATGVDTKGRKQYRYHPHWSALRSQTKFVHIVDFGKALPSIRQKLHEDVKRSDMCLEKVLALIVSVMQETSIRVGNSMYEKLYGSFGLTTLKTKHVSVHGNTIEFDFKGKKGVQHHITLNNKPLASIIKKCRDIPGKELFQYYGKDGRTHTVDSGMVNHYIKEISGGNFTAKDFRTWSGTLHAVEAFKEIGCFEHDNAMKKNVVAMLDQVASHLGNTRTVCKKYYVHPALIDAYSSKQLERYFGEAVVPSYSDNRADLKAEEQQLLHFLEHLPTLKHH